MSINIKSLLNLPALRNAKMIAGNRALTKRVASITVLEQFQWQSLEQKLQPEKEAFFGSEIVISSFSSISHDIEAQCETIRQLHRIGEVGLILYYVGIFLPKVSQKVIDLADSLDFVLICMPEADENARYSEVIYEVVEAIIKQQLKTTNIVSESLEWISALPAQQRNLDTTLDILARRVKVQLIVTNNQRQILSESYQASQNFLDLQGTLSSLSFEQLQQKALTLVYDEQPLFIAHSELKQTHGTPLHLFVINQAAPLSHSVTSQTTEVVQLFLNLWGEHYDDINTAQLVTAILNDESVKMRRLANILKIDVSGIQLMWLIPLVPSHQEQQLINEIKNFTDHFFKVTIVEKYGDFIVVLIDETHSKEDQLKLAQNFIDSQTELVPDLKLIFCPGMLQTNDVQKTYWHVTSYLETTKLIFQKKGLYRLSEINFSQQVEALINSGEKHVQNTLEILKPLLVQDDTGQLAQQELLETLACFLLDCQTNYQETAKQLYLHKNTIKYRISKANQLLYLDVTVLPDSYGVYFATAVYRLLNPT